MDRKLLEKRIRKARADVTTAKAYLDDAYEKLASLLTELGLEESSAPEG